MVLNWENRPGVKNLDHKYHPSVTYFRILFDVLGFIAPPILIVYSIISYLNREVPLTMHECVVIPMLIIMSGFAMIFAGNFFAEFVSDEKGLWIRFLWKNLFVPWEDVIAVKPFLNLSIYKHRHVIRMRSLTLFHRFYGLLYSFSIHPCIIFDKGISNCGELNRRLKANLRKNRNYHR